MMSLNFRTAESHLLEIGQDLGGDLGEALESSSSYNALRAVGVASLLLAVTAIGLFLGRELRQRYKFKRRTPYDFYAKAADPVSMSEYGMGV